MKTFEECFLGIRSTHHFGRFSSITTISEAVLLAAGLGTRFKPFSERMPKALAPLMGIPLLQFGVDVLKEAGIKKAAINIHSLADQMEKGLNALDWNGITYKVSDERKQLLGSAGGIRKAISLLGEGPFLIGNADTIYSFDPKGLLRAHLENRKCGIKLTLGVREIPPGQDRYRTFNWDPSSGVIEKMADFSGTGWFHSGWMVVEKEWMMALPIEKNIDFVEACLKPAISEKKAAAHPTEGLWFDLGSPLLWASAHFSFLEEIEKKSFPLRWKKRIESVNTQIQKGIWIKTEPYKKRDLKKFYRWKEPLYLGTSPLPLHAGPHSIGYGDKNEETLPAETISMGRHKISLAD